MIRNRQSAGHQGTAGSLLALIAGMAATGTALALPPMQMDPSDIAPANRNMTPAQQVALPDGGAPPPPHGYTEVTDTDPRLAPYSADITARQGPGLPPVGAHQNINDDNSVPSHFSVAGIPVKFNAPVTPPYDTDFTYGNYAGSSGRNYNGSGVAAYGTAARPQPQP
jgi:hypothetical protein